MPTITRCHLSKIRDLDLPQQLVSANLNMSAKNNSTTPAKSNDRKAVDATDANPHASAYLDSKLGFC